MKKNRKIETYKYNNLKGVRKSMSTAYQQDDRDIFVENILELVHK